MSICLHCTNSYCALLLRKLMNVDLSITCFFPSITPRREYQFLFILIVKKITITNIWHLDLSF